MKNKGFTLIELLATIVVLGIIMVVAIPNVTGILQKNRAKSYYEDAKKLVTLAEYKMRGNSSVERPTGNECLVMNLYYLDNSEFDTAPNGGQYDKEGSFVVIKYDSFSSSYKYYVRLLEEVTTDSYSGISFMESSELYKDVVLSRITSIDDRFSVDTQNARDEANAKINVIGGNIETAIADFSWEDCGSVIGDYARIP